MPETPDNSIEEILQNENNDVASENVPSENDDAAEEVPPENDALEDTPHENNAEQETPSESGTVSEPRPVITYVGEEELKHFLDFINILGDKKYLKVDAPAARAISADSAVKLAKDVLINGQTFNGTQDITFDEYAQKSEVLLKTDCAQPGESGNHNKVLRLNSKGKIDSLFVDLGDIENKVDASVGQMKDDLAVQTKGLNDTVAGLSSRISNCDANIQNLTSFVHLRQAKTTVRKDILPASIVITDDDNGYAGYCLPPLEILKRVPKSESVSQVDLADLYIAPNNDVEITEAKIVPKPRIVPLFVKNHSDDVTVNNYMEHEDAWALPVEVNSGGKTYTGLVSRFIRPYGNYKFESSLETTEAIAGREHYYGIVSGDDVYYVSPDKNKFVYNNTLTEHEQVSAEMLMKGASISSNDFDLNLCIQNTPELKEKTFNITVLYTDTNVDVLKDNISPISLVLKNTETASFVEPKRPLDFIDRKSADAIIPSYTGEDNGILFGAKMFMSDSTENAYAVWDENTETWKSVADIDDIIAAKTSIDCLEKLPVSAWNMENCAIGLVFIFTEQDSDSSINALAIRYVKAEAIYKAVHGVDYDYYYTDNNMTIIFQQDGEYLINYPATSSLANYDEKAPLELTANHTLLAN